MLVIGIDVYNVEAESLGCKVVYFEDSNDCPGIVEPIETVPLRSTAWASRTRTTMAVCPSTWM